MDNPKYEWIRIHLDILLDKVNELRKDLTEIAYEHPEAFAALIAEQPIRIHPSQRCAFSLREQGELMRQLITQKTMPYDRREKMNHFKTCVFCFSTIAHNTHMAMVTIESSFLLLTRQTLYRLEGKRSLAPETNGLWIANHIRITIPGIMKAIRELDALTSKAICSDVSLGNAIRISSKLAYAHYANLGSADTHWYFSGSVLPKDIHAKNLAAILDHGETCEACKIRFAFDDIYDEKIMNATVSAELALTRRSARGPQ